VLLQLGLQIANLVSERPVFGLHLGIRSGDAAEQLEILARCLRPGI